MTETEERTARDMQPDINMVDSYLYEIRDIDKAISLESSKLKGIGKSRVLNLYFLFVSYLIIDSDAWGILQVVSV